MERGLPCRTSLWGLCFFSLLLYMATAVAESSHDHATLSLSTPHLRYTCPEGATLKMVCVQLGAGLHPTDVLRHGWLFTPHSEQRCTGRVGPRHYTIGAHSKDHSNHSLPAGLQFGSSDHEFWVQLQNLTPADQGRYCCMVLDIQTDHSKHGTVLQKPHSHILLSIVPRSKGSPNCTVDASPFGPSSSMPVALAIAACLLALLALPLILLLVYKQRQHVQSHRRAQELVRMDSESPGHENPVFLAGSPQSKPRTVSQIMSRQTSDTGRHLLSEPGTPLSPPGHGDVFFPTEDTIPESPDLVQV